MAFEDRFRRSPGALGGRPRMSLRELEMLQNNMLARGAEANTGVGALGTLANRVWSGLGPERDARVIRHGGRAAAMRGPNFNPWLRDLPFTLRKNPYATQEPDFDESMRRIMGPTWNPASKKGNMERRPPAAPQAAALQRLLMAVPNPGSSVTVPKSRRVTNLAGLPPSPPPLEQRQQKFRNMTNAQLRASLKDYNDAIAGKPGTLNFRTGTPLDRLSNRAEQKRRGLLSRLSDGRAGEKMIRERFQKNYDTDFMYPPYMRETSPPPELRARGMVSAGLARPRPFGSRPFRYFNR